MESNQRYYERRAVEELRAAARAVTPEGQARRRALAEMFAQKAAQYRRPLAADQAGARVDLLVPGTFHSAAC